MTRGRGLRILLGGGLAALIVGRWLTVTATNRMWAESIGVAADHGAIARLQTLLFVWAFVVALVWTLGNLAVVYRSIGSVHVPRRLANIEIVEALPRRVLLTIVVALGVALSLATSYRAGEWWTARAMAANWQPLGVIEPILGRDIGYYLFYLPWQRVIHSYTLTLAVVVVGVLTISYIAIGAFAAQDRGLRVSDHTRRHLGVVLALVAVILVWGYRLETHESVAGLHGVPFDTVLIDVRLPTARILSALAMLAGVVSLVWIRYDRFSIVAFGWITLATFSILGHFLIPAVAGGSRSPGDRIPAEFETERARFEAMAYGSLSPPDSLPVEGEDGPAAVPIWHEFAVRVLAGRRLDSADLGLRIIDGRPEWLAVARQDSAGLASAVMMMPADSTDQRGGPVMNWSELPAPMRFGPGRRGVRLDSSRQMVGAALGGPISRLALAWRLQRWTLVSAPDTVRVLITRDVTQRLERFAPFAQFDPPSPATIEGRVVWLANGYVTADGFPLSRPVAWRGRTVGYVRSGFVGLVDGITGDTRVFLRPDADPLSAAWAAWAPETVTRYDAAPDALEDQLPFPEAEIEAWARLLGVTDTGGRLPFFPRRVDPPPNARPLVLADRNPSEDRLRLRKRLVVDTGEGSVLLEGSVIEGRPVLARYPMPEAAAAVERLEQADVVGVGSATALFWLPARWGAFRVMYANDDIDSLPHVLEIAVDVGDGLVRGATLAGAVSRAGDMAGTGLDIRGDWAAARLWFERLDRARRTGDWATFGVSYEALQRLFGMPRDSVP